ncbi:hypothetical protein J6590_097405 [Homalodisca vitripennis]|nr:hypothetical protein J6590_097405 [Homalodisca vitripennis]
MPCMDGRVCFLCIPDWISTLTCLGLQHMKKTQVATSGGPVHITADRRNSPSVTAGRGKASDLAELFVFLRRVCWRRHSSTTRKGCRVPELAISILQYFKVSINLIFKSLVVDILTRELRGVYLKSGLVLMTAYYGLTYPHLSYDWHCGEVAQTQTFPEFSSLKKAVRTIAKLQ